MTTPATAPLRESMSDGKLRIRRYRTEDVDALYRAIRESISQVKRWAPWCHDDYSRRESESWIAGQQTAWDEGREYNFLIEDLGDGRRSGGRMLGGCGLNGIDPVNQRANLGYWVRTSATGRGVATAAALLVARFGFEELQLARLEIVVAVGNTASQRVAAKTGAVREGIARSRLLLYGVPRDAVISSLLRGEVPG